MQHSCSQLIKRFITLLLALLITRQVVADDQAKLANVVKGWEQNRQIIGDVFLCEFTVDVYRYSDVDAPILLYTQSGIWARHGEFERYSIQCKLPPQISKDDVPSQEPIETKALRTDGMGGGGPCCEEYYLQCHDAHLSYSQLLSTANIQEGIKRSGGITTTPLSYGVMGANEYRNLPELIKQARDGRVMQAQVTFTGNSQVNETIVLRTERREVSSEGTQWDNIMEWRIDPSSGFLPREVTVFDAWDVWASRTTVTDVRKIESGAYWPFSVRTVSNPDSVIPRVFDMKTTRLSFDANEVESKLAIPVAPGTRIHDPDKIKSSYVFNEQEIHARQLSGLLLQGATTHKAKYGGRR